MDHIWCQWCPHIDQPEPQAQLLPSGPAVGLLGLIRQLGPTGPGRPVCIGLGSLELHRPWDKTGAQQGNHTLHGRIVGTTAPGI